MPPEAQVRYASCFSVSTPICRYCTKAMQMQRASRDQDYEHIYHVVFICECGRARDQMVAVSEPTPLQLCLQKSEDVRAKSVADLERLNASSRRYSLSVDAFRASIEDSYRILRDE